MKKLTQVQIIAIGLVVALVLFGAVYGALVKPAKDKTEELNASAKTVEDAGGTEAAVQGKERDLKKTEEVARKAEADWRVDSVRVMPALNFNEKGELIDLYQTSALNGNYGVKDIPTVWGTWLATWYDAQRNAGVTRETPVFAIPAYPTDPNKISELTNLTFPSAGKPWDVAVTVKSFDQAMAHLRRFNSIEKRGMPVVDNVRIAGHAPDLRLTYTLALYVIPGQSPPAIDPRIGGKANTGGGGGGGGFGGGMSAMMSGMSPGGSGGASGSGGGGGGASTPAVGGKRSAGGLEE
jgi:hypothetical protein